MKEKTKFIIIMFINIIIFGIIHIIFDVKYEQVDDFIIYNLYSGLDGTYNIHGIYIHPIICIVLSLLYRIIPIINWHSIFLLSMQFICFTLIGYTILKKHNNGIAIILYAIFASVFYSTLLLLVQYTSVAALLVLTSFILLIDAVEQKEDKNIKYKLLIFFLFTLGVLLRFQSLCIILPFMGIYLVINGIEYFKRKIEKVQLVKIIKYYSILAVITVITIVSNSLIYKNDVYQQYIEFNKSRSTLHDITPINYEENKEIFDEIGWSQNDYYMFYTFGFGDENVYAKEKIKKIVEYKEQKDGQLVFDKKISQVIEDFKSEIIDSNAYIGIVFFFVFIFSLFNGNKTKYNIAIFITTIAIHLLFIKMNRSMLRVVIPEYIIGTAWMMYNLKLKAETKVKDTITNCVILTFMITIIGYSSGMKYNFNYQLGDYDSIKDLIGYTSSHKENVYLYTVPSLQFRYLSYSIYEMPPKGAFSNLRVMGGWDMYTQNYYDFKERYHLDGTFLDLLKENVYLVDGDVIWSGTRYDNYKENVLTAIKEHYKIDAECEEIQQFDNLKIYKVNAITNK